MSHSIRKRILIVALIALPLLLALSYPWRNETTGIGSILSTIGWIGFMLALLVVLVLSIAVLVSSVGGRRHKATNT
jgi:hypothetical protein